MLVYGVPKTNFRLKSTWERIRGEDSTIKRFIDQCTILHVPNQSDSIQLLCDSGTTRFLLVLSFVSRLQMRTHLSSWPVGTAYPGTPSTNSHPILDTNSSALTVPSNRTQLTPGKSTFEENKKRVRWLNANPPSILSYKSQKFRSWRTT